MDNVIPLPGFEGVTFGHIEPDKVLESAKDTLSDVVVVGWTSEGELYLAHSSGEPGDVSLLLQLGNMRVLGG